MVATGPATTTTGAGGAEDDSCPREYGFPSIASRHAEKVAETHRIRPVNITVRVDASGFSGV
jgi:hypothetical protein